MNITSILKDCPNGTELYSTVHGKVILEDINCNRKEYPIKVLDKFEEVVYFTEEGKLHLLAYDNDECILFPSKDNRDWSTFEAPFRTKFNVGDFIVNKNGDDVVQISSIKDGRYYFIDCATDEFKFNKIDIVDKQYELWNIKNAISGDIIFYTPQGTSNSSIFIFKDISQQDNTSIIYAYCGVDIICDYNENEDEYVRSSPYYIKTDNINQNIFRPAFKTELNKMFKAMNRAGFYWDDYNLKLIQEIKHTPIENKFKPFDKVLVRDDEMDIWTAALYSHIEDGENSKMTYYVTCGGMQYNLCVPYEGNEQYVGTTNNIQ